MIKIMFFMFFMSFWFFIETAIKVAISEDQSVRGTALFFGFIMSCSLAWGLDLIIRELLK